jgi:hypothetical protein
MEDLSTMSRAVVRLGVTPLMRANGFKRPGGGRRFIRDRGLVRQIVYVVTELRRGFGRVRLVAEQRVAHHKVWSQLPHDIFLDVEHGDLEDAAIQAAAHLEEVLLPRLDVSLDLVALAQLYERRPEIPEQVRRHSSAELWKLLGLPDEAERVKAGARVERLAF